MPNIGMFKENIFLCIYKIHIHGAIRFNITQLRKRRASPIRVWTILFLDSSFSPWSAHHIEYIIPLITIKRTPHRLAKNTKYWIIFPITFTTVPNQGSIVHLYVVLFIFFPFTVFSLVVPSSQLAPGIFSVTVTVTHFAACTVKGVLIMNKLKREIKRNIFMVSFFIIGF